jgi:hypothetical protein
MLEETTAHLLRVHSHKRELKGLHQNKDTLHAKKVSADSEFQNPLNKPVTPDNNYKASPEMFARKYSLPKSLLIRAALEKTRHENSPVKDRRMSKISFSHFEGSEKK